MRLSKIKLRNYRCFGNEEQVIKIDDLTTFIGNNSAGKTAALAAINCIFSPNAAERVLQRSDFHLPKEMKPEDLERQELYIETVFEFDELTSNEGDGRESIPIFFQRLVVDNPGGCPYIRIRLEATWEKSNTLDGSIDSEIVYITCPETVEMEKNRTPARRGDIDKIRVVYVPAVREPAKQLRNVSGTMMHQLMNSINWSETTQGNVKTKIQELNHAFEQEKGVSIVGESLQKQWGHYDSDERYSKAHLRFNSTDIEASIKKTEVVFEPTVTGKEYTIDQMGDGLRSLFYISLVDSVLDIEEKIKQEMNEEVEKVSFNRQPPLLTIVALEEPENHIAPHLLGQLVGNLHDIAKKKNAQAIVTSHSPAIIKRVDPENLRYFRMDNKTATSKVASLTLPKDERVEDQYKYIKEAVKAYPELYFAKLVILGEGDSEEIVLPYCWETENNNVDIAGISIVPLGGRHVNHFWRLLNDLQIPHLTLLDLDSERYGGGWSRIKYVIEQLILNGNNKTALLMTKDGGILSDEEFDTMSDWDIAEKEKLQFWIDKLKNYNVFFSAPLDIDFLMLENMPEAYKQTLTGDEGPRREVVEAGKTKYVKVKEVEEQADYCEQYAETIEKDVALTLKQCGGHGDTYTIEQKKLMAWYNYFFLNRGKPSTHIVALSQLGKQELKRCVPSILQELMLQANNILKGRKDEECES